MAIQRPHADLPDWLELRHHRWACADRIASKEDDLADIVDNDTHGLEVMAHGLTVCSHCESCLTVDSSIANSYIVTYPATFSTGCMEEIGYNLTFLPLSGLSVCRSNPDGDGITWQGDGDEMVWTVGLTCFKLQMLVTALTFCVEACNSD